MKQSKVVMGTLALLLLASSASARVGSVRHGRASYHEHTGRMVTAARGVRRGAKLWVWRTGKSPRTGFAVIVNDSGPYVRGRILDLSTGAFKRLYGGLKRGHGPVSYKVLKQGKGARCG